MGERECVLVQVTHPEKRPEYDFHVAQVFFDPKLELPLRYACFSWPSSNGEPQLEEEYTYLDFVLNPDFTDEDFDPDNPMYKFPK